ncbi:hypothetical protein KKF34_06040 [Myxococcota bacterium]|nr:hypothetical protein [Myxococcota bacterium]MBU1381738.1 hypothetical protein [Myxococcota bacterium]MBU1496422.1 hypothetical protein [Myxococcota bacterium]
MNRFFLFSIILAFLSIACDPIDSDSNNASDASVNNSNNTNNTLNNINNQSDGGQDVESDSGTINPAWWQEDELGRQTEGNILGSDEGELVIVTTQALAETWTVYAGIKTGEGIFTEVVTVESIVSNYPGADDAEKVRNFLIERYNNGSLRFVLMGGDAGHVPFRRVENYIYATEEFTSNGPSQLYFSNLSADFDADGDGIYGEMNDDLTLEQSRQTNIAVGRISVSNTEEIENYIQKYIAYVTVPQGRITFPLLLSDIASTVPLIGDVDAAEGVEVTFDAFFPDIFHQNVRKLYATQSAADLYDGEIISVQKVHDALSDGYGMVFHNGHGAHRWITDILNSDFVNSLDNTIPPVMASCACLSGNFADKASSSTFDGWQLQGENEDSAAELFINSPHGGVAYIGNTGTGLGPIGGSQFLHAFYKGIFEEGLVYIGESFNYGRSNFRSIDYSLAWIPVTMTDDSEWWTSHVIILLGDPSLRIWTMNFERIYLETPLKYGPGYNELTVTVKDVNGSPLEGIWVTASKGTDFIIKNTSDSDGKVTFRFVPDGPGNINITASSENYFSTVVKITPDI